MFWCVNAARALVASELYALRCASVRDVCSVCGCSCVAPVSCYLWMAADSGYRAVIESSYKNEKWSRKFKVVYLDNFKMLVGSALLPMFLFIQICFYSFSIPYTVDKCWLTTQVTMHDSIVWMNVSTVYYILTSCISAIKTALFLYVALIAWLCWVYILWINAFRD